VSTTHDVTNGADPDPDSVDTISVRGGSYTIRNEPMTIGTKNRLYTTDEIRSRLGIRTYESGYNTPIRVVVTTVDRAVPWQDDDCHLSGYVQRATFDTSLRSYGEFRIPQAIMDRMGLSADETVRVDIRVLE